MIGAKQKVVPVKNKKGLKNIFWIRHVVEFFKTTGLHGYKYIAMDNISVVERLCWTVAVVACFVSAMFLVVMAWMWNDENPTITVIETTHYPTQKNHFPAVTICGLNKVSRKAALRVAKNLTKNQEDSEFDTFAALRNVPALLGNIQFNESVAMELATLQKILDYNNYTITYLMDRLVPPCESTMERCTWKGVTERCETLFQRVLTSEGFCCSFNYYGFKKQRFPAKVEVFIPKSPRKVAGCGFTNGLSVLIKNDPEDYYSSINGAFGAKVFIHLPYNFPDENASVKFVDRLSEAFFGLIPESTYSTTALFNIDVDKRRCIFHFEGNAMGYTRYTYPNCLVNCRSNIVFQVCGCVPFFFPNDGSRPVCSFKDVDCVYKIRSVYTSGSPNLNGTTCNCIPICQHTTYPVELSTGTLSRVTTDRSQSVYSSVTLTNQSLIHVFFNDLLATRFKRDVFLSWFSLLALFGGLLSLFIGFSLVAAFELFYFFTIRLFFDIAQKNKALKSKDTVRALKDSDQNKAHLLDSEKKKFDFVKGEKIENYKGGHKY